MIYDKEIVKQVLSGSYNKSFEELTKDIRFKPFVSYSTRLMRPNETDGVEHFFINDEKADEMLKDMSKILAYTEINNCRYFTTVDQMKDYNVYIIDPNGIEYFRTNHPDIKLNIFYIASSFNNRYRRFALRNGKEPTAADMWKFQARDDSENEQFTKFEKNNQFNSFINDNPYLNNAIINISTKIIDTYDPNSIICFVGRTASGKDTIVRHLEDLFKK